MFHILIDEFLKLHNRVCCDMCRDMDKQEPPRPISSDDRDDHVKGDDE